MKRRVEHIWQLYIEEIARTKDLLLKCAGDGVQVTHSQLHSQNTKARDERELESQVQSSLSEGAKYDFGRIILHFQIDLEASELYQVRTSVASGEYNGSSKSRNTTMKEEAQLFDIRAAGRKRTTRRRTLDSIIAMEAKHRNFWRDLCLKLSWVLHIHIRVITFFQTKWNLFVARMRSEQADRQRQRERYRQWTAQIEHKATVEANKVVPASDLQEKMKVRDEKVRVALELAKVEAAVKFEADKLANKLNNEKLEQEKIVEKLKNGHIDKDTLAAGSRTGTGSTGRKKR